MICGWGGNVGDVVRGRVGELVTSGVRRVRFGGARGSALPFCYVGEGVNAVGGSWSFPLLALGTVDGANGTVIRGGTPSVSFPMLAVSRDFDNGVMGLSRL